MQKLKTETETIKCEAIPNGIAVNPASYPLPMDGHRRTEDEINLWRRRTYVLGEGNEWKLFCLNKCGFRPDLWGMFETLDEAIREALTDEKQQIFL